MEEEKTLTLKSLEKQTNQKISNLIYRIDLLKKEIELIEKVIVGR